MGKRIIAGMLASIMIFSNTSINAFATTAMEDIGVEKEYTISISENKEDEISGSDNDIDVDTLQKNENVETETSDLDSKDEGSLDDNTVSENAIESVSGNLIAPEALYSTTKSLLIDTTEPYDGDYLLIANTSTIEDGAVEATGVFPTVATISMMSEDEGDTLFDDMSEDIYAYDKWGRGLIDPNSFLPEPELEVVSGSSRSVLRNTLAATSTEIAVGDTRVFYLDNDDSEDFNPVNCVCAAVGTYGRAWVPLDDPIYVANAELMKTYMSTVVLEFDRNFPKMTEMFGSIADLEKKYGGNDGKTDLVCYDIAGDGTSSANVYTGGYFYAADLGNLFSNATGNNCDLLHIDSWQGMSRNVRENVLDDVGANKGTIVHEFQHLINFAVNRSVESEMYTVHTPIYLNEAFSMAAEHLCYGADECEDRVGYYNAYPYIAQGNVSLFRWGGYDTLSNYSLSYLFGQYIRTQYLNGDTIYRDSMNAYDNQSKELLDVIAEKLGVTSSELLLNFRAALFLKNATGKYGFKGETWAEAISQQPVTGTSANLYPGAAIVVPLGESYRPLGAGNNIQFAGMYAELTDNDVTVSASGDTSITTAGGQVQLSATVYPSGVSQEVIYTIPDVSEKEYATVTMNDGLVTAQSNGSVTVRATSVYNPEKYDEITITITNQQRVSLSKTEEILDEGYRINYTATEPKNAKIYYEYALYEPYDNGNLPTDVDLDEVEEPTVESTPMPENGLEFTDAGVHVLKVIGVADGYASKVITSIYKVEEVAAPFINKEKNADGTYTITLQAQDDASIAYTTDGTDPVRTSTQYTESFLITTPGWTTVKAIAYKPGCKTSWVREEYNIEVPVATPDITVDNVLGGKEVTIETATQGAEIYYTVDGTEPTISSDKFSGTLFFTKEDIITLKAVAIIDDSLVQYITTDANGDPYEEEQEFDTTSQVDVETFTIGKTKAVISSRTGNILNVGDKIALYSATSNASIYYTLDGSIPTSESTEYSSFYGITMHNTKLQLGAFARSLGNQDSDVSWYTYVPYTELTELSIDEEAAQLYMNVEDKNLLQLNVSMIPKTAYAEQLEWSSSDTSVVTVNDMGVITAVSVGTAVITASSGSVSDTCTVTVNKAVKSLELLNDTLIISKDKGTLQLNTKIYPLDASNVALKYIAEMSDRDETQGVAMINQNGLLTAVKNGAVKVTIEPLDNAAGIEPLVVYVTISGQKSYNSSYKPRLSSSSISLNKKALEGVALDIYSLGNETSIRTVAFDSENRYAQYFKVILDEDTGKYEVALTEEGKANLQNGTYLIPLEIESEISLGSGFYVDAFSTTLRIRVIDRVPSITAETVTVNRYYTKTEYPVTIRSLSNKVTILGVENKDETSVFTDNFDITDEDGIKLIFKTNINEVPELDGKTKIAGYIRVQAAGYEEQLVPISVSISDKAPKLVVDSTAQILNYTKLRTFPEVTVTIAEKNSSREQATLDEIQSVSLDSSSNRYETLTEVISGVSTDGINHVTVEWNADNISAKTYNIPLLITTAEYKNVPMTLEMTVQRASVMPKVRLYSTTLQLNRNYPEETSSTAIWSVSQSNVELENFVIEARDGLLTSNADEAVSLIYSPEKQCLTAAIVGTPRGTVYKFTCIPQFADGVVSDQEIVVTVKLHEKKASVRVNSSGKIDVLRRGETSVKYSVTKINFTDEINSVRLIAPEKTSDTIWDGSNSFICTWDEEKECITVTAKEDAVFVKGKKYAFRFEIRKQYGLNGSEDDTSKTIVTDDVSIKPSQSYVRFSVDQVPTVYRYVSQTTNTQSVNLRTNIGEIKSVEVKTDYPLPEGVTANITNTLESLSYDGVDYYSLEPGTYICRLNVVMKGQLREEDGGELVEEPLTCHVKFVVH